MNIQLFRGISFFLIVTALAACGGGGSDAPSTTPANTSTFGKSTFNNPDSIFDAESPSGVWDITIFE